MRHVDEADENAILAKAWVKVIKFRKLRTNRSALTSSTIEMAICETTKVRWKEKRSRPDGRSATSRLQRHGRSRSRRSQRRNEIKQGAGGQRDVPVKARARQSRPKSSRSVGSWARSSHTMVRLNTLATAQPKIAPPAARTNPSASN